MIRRLNNVPIALSTISKSCAPARAAIFRRGFSVRAWSRHHEAYFEGLSVTAYAADNIWLRLYG